MTDKGRKKNSKRRTDGFLNTGVGQQVNSTYKGKKKTAALFGPDDITAGDRETLRETEKKRIKTTQIEVKKARRTEGFLARERPGLPCLPGWLALIPECHCGCIERLQLHSCPLKPPAIKGKPEGQRCLLATPSGSGAELPLGPPTKELNLAQG